MGKILINLQGVSVTRNQNKLLKEIDWHVNKGEHWSILGLNGSGKTTLLNVINGYIFPTTGHVEVFNEIFGKTYLPDLRKKIGLVSTSLQHQFQDFETVLSIVLSGKFASIGLWEEVEQKDVDMAQYYLGILHCEHLIDQQYGILSQGERQRVLIARALMANLELLILDEPCNGLDIIAREELLHFIETLTTTPNCPTLIFVTHHVEEVLPCFEHTLLLKKGEVFKKGLTKDLLTEENLTAFYDRPIAVQVEQDRIWLALKEGIKKD